MSENWKSEMRSAHLYRVLAAKEKNTPQARLFQQLAVEAENQAKIWKDPVPALKLDIRTRLVSFLIRKIGPKAMLPVLAAHKVRGLSIYTNPLAIHPTPQRLEEVGGRHKGSKSGGNLRASIFGVNDGVISNSLLILGFAGATESDQTLLMAGTAGLLAGAFSMAAGEFISVRSQKELYDHQIGLEKEELEKYPDEEAAELALIYEAKGIPKEEAKKLAKQIIQDPKVALDTLAKEELGIDPQSIGSASQASLFSFLSFSIGAFVPLIAFLIPTPYPLQTSLILAAAALFATGAFTGLLTGRNLGFAGARMLLIGILAGSLIYFIGRIFGQSLS